MDTEVTGIFPDRQHAAASVAHLRDAGIPADRVRIVDERAPDRREFIHARTADRGRGVAFGIVFGTLVGVLAGALLGGVFDAPAASMIIGGVVGGVGGAVLGLLVGGATTSQVEGEIGRQVDAGNVLVSVTADAELAQKASELMAKDGAVNLVSTAATFRGGVLPINEPGQPQEEIEPKR